ncbi:P-loop NTPase fold protein [Methanolobus profundi]|uniref:AAA ATPase domain-containing protein n=1 Tax=Methanolobus profundi TaxID=487685 RepID=A0A1I4UM86_9EURY|nr:P-loop NTPase fold protein [Methanolobus profundi]SFM90035.1 AAA ATPase domain-containing protein [Methanolobus profundi]
MSDELKQIFMAFRPEQALKDEYLKRYYVGINENEKRIAKLKTILDLGLNEPMKLLFMGHRGSGKTTALNRLVSDLDGTYLVIFYDVIDLLDPNDVNYTDVLFSTLAKLIEAAEKENVTLSSGLKNRIEKWGSSIVKIETESEAASVWVGAGISTVLLNLFARMKSESETRYEIRKNITPKISELINIINDTIIEIESKCKPILVVIDNLEKTEQSNAMDIFVNHSTQITQPICKIIFTFPIGLRSCDQFSQIRSSFDYDIMYPNIKIRGRGQDIKEDEHFSEDVLSNRNFMRNIFELRGNLELIDPKALDYIIDISGGVLREYIRIIRDASLNSISSGKDIIDLISVEEVVNDLKNTYRSQLDDEDYETILDIIKDQRLKRDSKLVRLLHNLSVLEYANGENWCDANPVVRLILKEQSLLGEDG